jgi:hypothetical protein
LTIGIQCITLDGLTQTYQYNSEKNRELKRERGVSFDEIVVAIGGGNLLDVIAHPNQLKYSHQKIYVVKFSDYIYLVPFVETKKSIFLKTIFPSRKLTRQYLYN